MGRLFGTNGIRGVVGEEMTVELAQRIGLAVATHVGGVTACLGRDARVSSPALADAVASGLTAGGFDVVDLGLVPTPTVHHAVARSDHDVGVIVTASHNPPEFNGIKVVAGDGVELPPDGEAAVESIVDDETWETVGWSGIGTRRRDRTPLEDYVEAVRSQVDEQAIADADLDVALDLSNGAGCVAAPPLLSRLDVDHVTLNAQPDGAFPGHPSEPSPENAQDLVDLVGERGADLGAIQDGDADRCIFVDDEGRYVPGERMMAVVAHDVVERSGGGLVVTPVATSLAVEAMVERAGGEVEYTAVGSPVVNRRLVETGGVFGGEENGGFVFPAHQFGRDALMTLAYGLDLVARKGPLSELLAEVPDYRTVKTSVECPEDAKAEVLDALRDKVAEDHDRVDTLDGVKVWLDDGWVLVRPSGTEPLIRVFAEAADPELARERADSWVDEVEALVGGAT